MHMDTLEHDIDDVVSSGGFRWWLQGHTFFI